MSSRVGGSVCVGWVGQCVCVGGGGGSVCGHVHVGGWFIVSVCMCVPTNFMSACPPWYAYIHNWKSIR